MHVLLIDGQYVMSCVRHKIHLEHGSEAGNDILMLASISFINDLLKKQNYNQVLLCLDDPSRSLRREMHPSYKEGRVHNLNMAARTPMFIRSIKSIGVMSFVESGFDAVDIMASVMNKAAKLSDLKVTAMTNDRRVYPHLYNGMAVQGASVFDSKKPKITTPFQVKEEFGNLSRKQLVGVLSLMGDQKRGIPGVSGVGLKKACNIMSKHTDVMGVLSNIDEVRKMVSSADNQYLYEDLKLSYGLTVLNGNIPLEITSSEVRII